MHENELMRNKSIARQFVTAIADGDVVTLEALHHPNATWFVPGAGSFDLQSYIKAAGATLAKASKRTVTITGITAEGDRVALEVEAELVFPDVLFRNQYHHLLVIRDGLIVTGREYLDTAAANAAFAK